QVVPSTLAGQSVTIARESLTGDTGFFVVARNNDAPTIFEALCDAGKKFGVIEPSAQAREALRIEAGLPRYGRDILPNAVASELGINHEAFSYDKGCYIGQEILARIHTKAEVPFRLMGVCFAENASIPPSGTTLDAPDSKGAAVVTSAAYSPTLGRPIAIARVKRGYQTQGVKLANGAEVVELPLYVPAPSDKRSDLYDRAITLFAQDRGAEALALLEQELAANPANIDALEALGVIHDRAGRHKEAIVAMKRIVERDPKHLMANVNLSLYHMKLGDKATAEDYQAKATRISMERRMAEARAQGKTPTAEDDAQRAAKLEARLDKFKAIIEMDPKDVLGHFGAGKACIDLKRFREAAGHFEKVVELQRDYSVAWANLGAAYAALGETDKARKVFEEGIAVAGAKGDLMPKRDMEHRLSRLT
ncbi:MAG: tetratricopeptide repeat protein, partial [Planctomycetes bacterium]|nr:tetratricopeptide repeat protein [Planctomycetota bacterium]